MIKGLLPFVLELTAIMCLQTNVKVRTMPKIIALILTAF